MSTVVGGPGAGIRVCDAHAASVVLHFRLPTNPKLFCSSPDLLMAVLLGCLALVRLELYTLVVVKVETCAEAAHAWFRNMILQP